MHMPDTILTPWKPDRVHANLIGMALEDEAFHDSLVHCWTHKCSPPFLLLVYSVLSLVLSMKQAKLAKP
jgi:hypothetical protein